MRCDLVQDALVPPGQRARVRTTPPGLSGTRTGGRRRMGSALIRRYVTTSELGLRLISKADPRELCPREPASEARLSFLEPRHFIKLFVACSANLRWGLEHLFPAVWTHSKEGTQPPPPRPRLRSHVAERGGGICPPWHSTTVPGAPTDPHSLRQPPMPQKCAGSSLGSHRQPSRPALLGGRLANDAVRESLSLRFEAQFPLHLRAVGFGEPPPGPYQ